MIEVTRFNGSICFVNPDMILFVEPTPDTIITLTTGDKVLVKETPEEVLERFVALKRRIVIEGPAVKERQPVD